MNDTVLIALIAFVCSSITALCVMILKIFYASKCKNYSCCWDCIKANDRDTKNEVSIRGLEIGQISMPNISNHNHHEEIQL